MNKKYKIQFTSKANSDYYNVLEHSLNISFKYYKKICENFNSKILNILENPYIYPIIQTKRKFRKVTICNYILVYEIYNHTIIVYRIFSGKIKYSEYI